MQHKKQINLRRMLKIEPILIGALIAGGVFGAYIITSRGNNSSPTISEIKPVENRYRAEGLGISFEYSSEGTLIKDFSNQVVIEKGENQMVISRVDPMFDSLDAFLTDLIEKNNMNVTQTEQIALQGDESASLLTLSTPRGVEYVAYVMYDGWVYSFSADSKDQESELRQLLVSLEFE